MRRGLWVFILILQLFFYPVDSSEESTFTDAIFPRTDPKCIGVIYQMLKMIDELFTEHGIPYWIDGGTALGCVRHGGFIPWDDDADLVFHIEDEPRILALAHDFATRGYFLTKEEIIRLYPSKKQRYPFIDIAGYKLCADQTLRFAYKPARRRYWQFYWLPEEVSPLVRVKFGPITVSAPNTMNRYLLEGYGEDCLTKATYQTHHRNGKKRYVITERVDVVDFSPAQYDFR